MVSSSMTVGRRRRYNTAHLRCFRWKWPRLALLPVLLLRCETLVGWSDPRLDSWFASLFTCLPSKSDPLGWLSMETRSDSSGICGDICRMLSPEGPDFDDARRDPGLFLCLGLNSCGPRIALPLNTRIESSLGTGEQADDLTPGSGIKIDPTSGWASKETSGSDRTSGSTSGASWISDFTSGSGWISEPTSGSQMTDDLASGWGTRDSISWLMKILRSGSLPSRKEIRSNGDVVVGYMQVRSRGIIVLISRIWNLVILRTGHGCGRIPTGSTVEDVLRPATPFLLRRLLFSGCSTVSIIRTSGWWGGTDERIRNRRKIRRGQDIWIKYGCRTVFISRRNCEDGRFGKRWKDRLGSEVWIRSSVDCTPVTRTSAEAGGWFHGILVSCIAGGGELLSGGRLFRRLPDELSETLEESRFRFLAVTLRSWGINRIKYCIVLYTTACIYSALSR